jgi:hypothetical protein
MLWDASAINGYAIKASDGQVGRRDEIASAVIFGQPQGHWHALSCFLDHGRHHRRGALDLDPSELGQPRRELFAGGRHSTWSRRQRGSCRVLFDEVGLSGTSM